MEFSNVEECHDEQKIFGHILRTLMTKITNASLCR